MEIAIEAPGDSELQRALMFDPRFHDATALVDELPVALLPHEHLGRIAALVSDTSAPLRHSRTTR